MTKRGRTSVATKVSNKNKNNKTCVGISITIPQDLLQNIEKNVKGSSRSQKITKCAKEGLSVLMVNLK